MSARAEHANSGAGRIIPEMSSSVALGASGTFTSPWMLVSDLAAIRISIFSDVAGDLRTQHSPDGSFIIRDSHQPTTANRSEFLSFHPRSAFFRIVYDNSTTAQTVFHLTTIFSDTAQSTTQSQYSSPLGRTSLAVQGRSVLYDFEFDETALIAPQIRDLAVTERISLIGDNFRQAAGLDTRLWTTTNTGTGTATITITDGRLLFQTGTTANSTSKVQSTVNGRFISGSLQFARVGVKLPNAGDTNCKRRWGAYDDNNGYFFELDGTTLYAVSRRAGTDTRVAAASWNIISTFVLSSAGGSNRYEITYFGNTAYFSIAGENYHLMSGEVGGLPRTAATNFPNRFEIINSGGEADNNQLIITGTSQQRYGPANSEPRFLNIVGAATTVVKSEAGRLRRVIVGAGSGANTCAIYDNTAGSGTLVSTLSVNKLEGSVEFDTNVQTGLTVVTTGSDTDVTVVYD